MNLNSGLVVSLYEKDNYGFRLDMYSLHNSSDSSKDYDSTLFCKYSTFEEAWSALKDLVGYNAG